MERIDSARQKLADLRAAKLDLLEALEEAETTEAKWDFLNLPESFCCSTATVKELSYYGILFSFFFRICFAPPIFEGSGFLWDMGIRK